MTTKHPLKRIENTCFLINARGEVFGRNNKAQIYPDRNGCVSDCGKEYNVKEVAKQLFPKQPS